VRPRPVGRYVKINSMNSSPNEALSRIRVVAETGHAVSNGTGLLRKRAAVQIGTLALLVLIPVSGLFRIDPATASFVVLDRQIWFSDFLLVAGFWLTLSGSLILTYSTLGMAFCGWSCPQNTMSEWANRMTKRLLGKWAEVSLEGEAVHVSAGKKKWANWLLLGVLFSGAALGFALIPLLYFYPPDVVWSFITFRHDTRLAPSLYWIYTVFVLIMLVNVAVVRHFFCRFMCIYRVWQHSFKTRHTLHVGYDASRDVRCATCNYCLTVCPVEIDPRNTTTFDSCINCGLCISACDALQFPKGESGLLFFEFGERKLPTSVTQVVAAGARLKQKLGGLGGRLGWVSPVILIGVAMFAWGSVQYQPYHLSVYRADQEHGAVIQNYRINLVHKLYRPGALNVSIAGLSPDSYQLSASEAHFTTAEHKDLLLTLDRLPKGLYTLRVTAHSDDGWQASQRIQHYSPGAT